MAFSGYVAWKLGEAADILDEVEARPVVPLPTGTGIPAPLRDASGVLQNLAAIRAAAATNVADNQAEIDEATASLTDWTSRNCKLYGLLMQAVPDCLRTSLYNAHRNDGLAAVLYFRGAFELSAHTTQLTSAHVHSRQASSLVLLEGKA